jgi:hypothetical protein
MAQERVALLFLMRIEIAYASQDFSAFLRWPGH